MRLRHRPRSRREAAARVVLPLLTVLLFSGGGGLGAQLSGEDDLELEVRAFDVVELENGQRLEGEVLQERTSEIVFRQRGGGQATLPRANIRRILKKNPPQRVYTIRRQKHFDPSLIEDQRALAHWCLEPGIDLIAEGIFHLEEGAGIAPAEADLYETLIPLYLSRDPSTRTTAEHDRELATCLLGIEADVAGEGLSVHAAQMLVGLGDRRGAILLLEPLGEGGGPGVALEAAQDLLATLLDHVGRSEEARRFVEGWLANRGAGESLPLWRLRARWLLEDTAAGIDGAAESLDQTLKEVIALAPEDGRAHLLRGALAMLRDDPASARSDFEKAFALSENGAEAALTYALNFARLGEPQKALELVGMARRAEGYADATLLVEAYARENMGDTDLASVLLDDVLVLPDASWQAWISSLQGRARLDDRFPLEQEARRALDRFGENPAAFAELSVLIGDTALTAGKFADARRWLGYAAAAGRALPEVLLRLGLAHFEQGGDPRRARDCLEAAAAAEPENADMRNALGALEYRAGDLGRAQAQFEAALRIARAPSDSDEPLPPARVYALSALEQIDRTLAEEVWSDDFAREDSSQILNKWEKSETFGVTIELRDKAVRFSGVQKFQSDGLTRLHRPVDGTTLARVRAQLRLEVGAAARIGLRLARVASGGEGDGVVVYRDLDGVMAVALNSGEETTEIRSDEVGEKVADLELIPTSWPDDGVPHWIEIRLPRPDQDESAAIYLDGRLVMRGFETPRFQGRAGATVGVSGQADLEQGYRFDVVNFELFRRRPRTEGGSTNR